MNTTARITFVPQPDALTLFLVENFNRLTPALAEFASVPLEHVLRADFDATVLNIEVDRWATADAILTAFQKKFKAVCAADIKEPPEEKRVRTTEPKPTPGEHLDERVPNASTDTTNTTETGDLGDTKENTETLNDVQSLGDAKVESVLPPIDLSPRGKKNHRR